MAGINKVIIVGMMGKDPEIRNTQDGKQIAHLSLATSESWKDKASGERKEKTEWHRVVLFSDHLAGIAKKYLKKGSKIYIEGQLQTRKWTDQAGIERYSTEIVVQGYSGIMQIMDKLEQNSEEPARNYTEPQETYDDEVPF